MRNPLEQAATLERVVQLARAVGRDDQRTAPRPNRSDLRDRDLEIGEDLEQERLELLVGAVDLVDQQHGADRAVDRLQQRARGSETPVRIVSCSSRRALLVGAECSSWRA